MTRRTLTAGAGEVSGRIGGAVLAAVRSTAGLTQETLAEHLRVGLSTVQAWESGRRPLVNASFQDLQRLTRQLRHEGVEADLVSVMEQALLVDSIYTDMALTEDAAQHPLAVIVPDRTVTELLAWPLTGHPPRELGQTKARLHVPSGVRDAVAAGLCAAAERSPHSEREAMMRRQVKFLVADVPSAQTWVRDQVAAEVRATPDLRSWSPQWAVARSQAVSAAHAGDLEPIRRFIAVGLSEEPAITANLNYWAYWVGEHAALWTEDADMIRTRSEWSGERLLDSLLDGVVAAPYRELCVHALWALLRQRGHLLKQPEVARRASAASRQALDSTELEESSRRRLEQVLYLAESVS